MEYLKCLAPGQISFNKSFFLRLKQVSLLPTPIYYHSRLLFKKKKKKILINCNLCNLFLH